MRKRLCRICSFHPHHVFCAVLGERQADEHAGPRPLPGEPERGSVLRHQAEKRAGETGRGVAQGEGHPQLNPGRNFRQNRHARKACQRTRLSGRPQCSLRIHVITTSV